MVQTQHPGGWLASLLLETASFFSIRSSELFLLACLCQEILRVATETCSRTCTNSRAHPRGKVPRCPGVFAAALVAAAAAAETEQSLPQLTMLQQLRVSVQQTLIGLREAAAAETLKQLGLARLVT